ncbi:MAG TPA: hypothetical protein VGC13_13245 [Longimicrobium sp.]|jgi:hypothetical protein|uniref:hypothetical protein n=1 Tax=Longimicrobium sp. TaxID=2029185 RepID=UPI002ED824BE
MADHILGAVTASATFEVAAPTLDRGGAVYNVKHPDFWGQPTVADAFEDADAAAASGGYVYVPRGTYLVNRAVTLSANWKFAPGAVVKPDTGITVTFTGGIEASPAYLFDESIGTVAFTTDTRIRELYVEWWQAPGQSNFTAAFVKVVKAQASTRSVPIQLQARTYIGGIVIPDNLYLFPRGGFIIRGMGPKATTLQSVNAATPAIAYDATVPGTGFDTNKLHLSVTIENMSINGRYAAPTDAGNADVVHLRGLRGIAADLPNDTVGRRVYGRLRDLWISGISTPLEATYSTANAILIRAPFAMEIENVITESSDWGLRLEGGSNCSVIHFNTMNNSFGGIYIEEGGSHTFVRPRIEDRNKLDSGITACFYLKDSGANTFFGWGNEGKGGLDYTVFLHGTQASRPVINNVFLGGGVGGANTTLADTRTDFATILIKGHCFNNYFRTGAQRPSKRDTASPPVVPTTYYDAVRLETETETLNGVTTTLTPRHNHLHLSYTDFADPFPMVNLGPDPSSNVVELVERNVGKKRVLGRDVAKTAAHTLKEYEVGLTFNNSGAAGTTTFTLPAAKAGMEYSFLAAAAAVRVDPAGSESIRGGGAGKYLEIPAGGGATLRCVADGSWEIFLSRGTLTFEP